MLATFAIDEAVQRWVVAHRTPGLDRAALRLTELGGTPVVLGVTLAVAAIAWWRTRRWWLVALCIGGELVVEVAARLLKVAVDRPRPPFDQALVVLANSSFPAAHVGRALYAGCLVWALTRATSGRRISIAVAAAVLLVVVVVAWTRVWVGAHWLTDTIGALPLALAAAALPAWQLSRRTDTARPPP